MVKHLTAADFEAATNASRPVLVDFWASWCGPCRMIAPIVSKLAEEYDGKIVVGKCDVEENDDVAAEYRVRNIPTLLFFKGGELVGKHVGAITEGDLRKKFDELL